MEPEPEPEPEPTPEIVRVLKSRYSEPEPHPDTGLEFKKETNSGKTVSSPLGRDIRDYDKKLEDEIKEYGNFIIVNNEKIRKENLSKTEISRLEDDNIFYNEKIEEIKQQIIELRQGRTRKRLSSNSSTENIDSSGVRGGTGTQPIPIPPRPRLKSKKRKHKKSKKRKYKSKKRRKKKQTKKT